MTDDLRDLDTRFHFHPQTEPRGLERDGPLILTRGDGVSVTDSDGSVYLEGMASLWCAALGFSDRRLAAAAMRQLETLPTYHTFNRRSNPPAIELAAALAALAPFPSAHVSYVNSGSEAVDSMVKAAWLYQSARGKPAKRKIISRDRAYHGSTVLGAALCGLPHVRGAFVGSVQDILFVSAPDFDGHPDKSVGEEAFVAALLEELQDLIVSTGPETIAAMIAEPVMGAGGVVIPPRSYFPKVQALLREHDILLLSDEVICGFGRTGRWFGCETFGYVPDMLCVAKALSSGYQPIGAVLMSDEIYQVVADEAQRLGAYGHGFTYAGHPVTSAVALETLRIYDEIDLIARVGGTTPHFTRLIQASAQHQLVAGARSVGLIGAVELVPGPDGKPLAPKVVDRALSHGLIVRSLGNAVAFCPPLIVTPAELEEMFIRFRATLDEVAANPKA